MLLYLLIVELDCLRLILLILLHYFKFNLVWANHGDDISIQYAGTPALKGDFVRYHLPNRFLCTKHAINYYLLRMS